jgi:antitoxin HicB
MTKKKKAAPRSARSLTSLDDLLKQDRKMEELEAIAIKEVLSWQLGEAIKAGNLSRKRLAERGNEPEAGQPLLLACE